MQKFHWKWIGFAAACFATAALFAPAAAQMLKKHDKPQDICSREYKPVCTRTRDGVLTTFANECLAKASGAAILLNGRCDDDLKCPPIELSVCGRKAGKNSTYTNSCVAEKQGAVVLMRDQCPEQCKPDGKQVCAVNEKGSRETFANSCQATLQGARVLHNGKCFASSKCNLRGLRVCATSANGVETQYASLCQAEMDNASWIHNGKCKPGIFRRMLQRYGIVKAR